MGDILVSEYGFASALQGWIAEEGSGSVCPSNGLFLCRGSVCGRKANQHMQRALHVGRELQMFRSRFLKPWLAFDWQGKFINSKPSEARFFFFFFRAVCRTHVFEMVRKMLLSWMLRDCSDWDSSPEVSMSYITGRQTEHTAVQLEVPVSLSAGLSVPRRAGAVHTGPSPLPKCPAIESMPDAQTQQVWLLARPRGRGVSSAQEPLPSPATELWCACCALARSTGAVRCSRWERVAHRYANYWILMAG